MKNPKKTFSVTFRKPQQGTMRNTLVKKLKMSQLITHKNMEISPEFQTLKKITPRFSISFYEQKGGLEWGFKPQPLRRGANFVTS